MSNEDLEGLLNGLFSDPVNLSKFTCNGQLVVNFSYSSNLKKYSISLCELGPNILQVNKDDPVNGNIFHRAQTGVLEFTELKPIEDIINEEIEKFSFRDYFHVSFNGKIYSPAKVPSHLKRGDEGYGIKPVV